MIKFQDLMAARNERKLFWRKCDLTKKRMLSTCREDVDFPVYNLFDWWNTPHSQVGLNLDFNKPFFEQLAELSKLAVRPSMEVQFSTMENSEYCNCANRLKNCYLVFEAINSQDCYYSRGVYNSNNCYECLNIDNCNFSYECIDCKNCYKCHYLNNSQNCFNCYYSRDIFNCKNCYGCVNISNKEYCYFNKQLDRTTYQAIIKNKKYFKSFQDEQIKKDNYIFNSENCSGDYIRNSKNVRNSFDITDGENLDNCFSVFSYEGSAVNCSNIVLSFMYSENCHNSHAVGMNAYNISYSDAVWGNVRDVNYSQLVVNGSQDCFGCISLIKSKYCILNKQYTKHEYEKLIFKLKEHMKNTGEYEQFIPKSIYRFKYNDSLAQDYFPLSKLEIENLGYSFGEEIYLSDDNFNKCVECSRNFKMIKQETDFYNENKLDFPINCFECRHKNRMAQRRKIVNFKSNCNSCNKDIFTSVKGKVFCNQCYNNFIY